jgi:short-subunit dehydrogenase
MVEERVSVGVVTGATGGIGRAITLRLARQGFRVYLIARNLSKLEALAGEVEELGGHPVVESVDLSVGCCAQDSGNAIAGKERFVDRLIHAAGFIELESTEEASSESLERHFTVNFKSPYMLTRNLIKPLVAARGQVVFLNSSVVQFPNALTSEYAASKHALKGFADSLRVELNPRGVRVLSVFPGRTASCMQESIHEQEGREFRPAEMLQPDDVATIIDSAVDLPMTAEVTEIHIRPMQKLS